MIERVQSEAAPWGGAVVLSLQADPDTYAVVYATPDPTPPDPLAPGAARLVHDGPLLYPSEEWRHTHPLGTRPWWQVADLATEALTDEVPVHYHAFERLGAASYSAPITVAATPVCLTHSRRTLARDLVKKRLAYHLTRGLASGELPPVNEDGWIPIEEKEALADDHAVPVVLIKERVVPSGTATIGRIRGEIVNTVEGKTYREYARRVRSVVELLLVCDTPQHRTELGAFLHNVLEQDVRYFQLAGLEDLSVQSTDRHEVGPQRDFYLTELSVECEGEILIREELRVRVSEDGLGTQDACSEA